jgi:Spy/CpxP family protein refolding chaperone
VYDEGFGGGGFGVRRPLRFLAHKLGLDERQVAELARVLDELKTERAQAEVDRRRTVAAFADAVAGEAFDAAKAGEGGALRLQSAERLRAAVLKALQQIHAALKAEQRARLAYLIRTGTLAV